MNLRIAFHLFVNPVESKTTHLNTEMSYIYIICGLNILETTWRDCRGNDFHPESLHNGVVLDY